jgi:hypothetical protein
MLKSCKALKALFLIVPCLTGEPNAAVDEFGDEGSDEKSGSGILWRAMSVQVQGVVGR